MSNVQRQAKVTLFCSVGYVTNGPVMDEIARQYYQKSQDWHTCAKTIKIGLRDWMTTESESTNKQACTIVVRYISQIMLRPISPHQIDRRIGLY